MNKKLRQNKGITLIALIITIVILLILATVTINTIQQEAIIGKAEEAAQSYKTEAKNENTYIAGAEDIIKKYILITFFIEGEEYTALKGMTWEEWLFGTNVVLIDDNGKLYDVFGGERFNLVCEDNGEMVLSKEKIISDTNYAFWSTGILEN